MSSKDYIYCYQGSALRVAGGTAVIGKNYDKYNPLGLPPFTIRAKFKPGVTPTMGDSQTIVDPAENVWDITNNNKSWYSLFANNGNLISILGANSKGVTEINTLFIGCRSLTSVQLFDTSSCLWMNHMFMSCSSLVAIPEFDLTSCLNLNFACYGCPNVQSGALSLYKKASSKERVPDHQSCFENCGSNTESGRAELAQIPTDWGGTMSA
jgi:hypothetical protein